MIKQEFFAKRSDGVKMYRTYSDKNMRILQNETNIIYDEAIDVEPVAYTYEETEDHIEETVAEEIDT